MPEVCNIHFINFSTCLVQTTAVLLHNTHTVHGSEFILDNMSSVLVTISTLHNERESISVCWFQFHSSHLLHVLFFVFFDAVLIGYSVL